MLLTGLGVCRGHPPSHRAGPHLGFETLHIIETHPLVILEDVGHLLVLVSVLPLPGAHLQERRLCWEGGGRPWQGPASPYREGARDWKIPVEGSLENTGASRLSNLAASI